MAYDARRMAAATLRSPRKTIGIVTSACMAACLACGCSTYRDQLARSQVTIVSGLAQGIEPWMGERSLPMWLPLPEYAGFMTRDTTPSLQAGLSIRPLADTARDTLAWLATDPKVAIRSGITPSDESAVLAAWHNRPTT